MIQESPKKPAPKVGSDPLLHQKIESVNKASSLARTLFVFFMLITLYVAVTINHTDDMDLLFLNLNDVKLPIVNIAVNIKSFYLFMPWIYLILHANLLLVFVIISNKFLLLNHHIRDFGYRERQSYRKMLHSFFLTQFLSRQHSGLLRWILGLLLWTTCCILPVYTLLMMQIDFLPAQYSGILWSQRIAVGFSIGVNVYVFYDILNRHFISRWPHDWKPRILRRFGLGPWVSIFLLFYAVCVSFFVAVIPASPWEMWIASCNDSKACPYEIETTGKKQLAAVSVTAALKGHYEERVCRARTPLFYKLPFLGKMFDSAYLFDDPSNWLAKTFKFHRRLSIPPETLVIANAGNLSTAERNRIHRKLNKGEELTPDDLAILDRIDLTGRSFNFASLKEVVFPKEVNLTNTSFIGTILDGAWLQGAYLDWAKLQGADLTEVQLQGADLFRAQLQGARLLGAQLQGARLLDAQLQGAYLFGAQLQGADLFRAQLQGADLERAKLQGADLFRAQLQGADLTDAQLQGADLERAKLQGADLFRAQLQGADFTVAQLQGADFTVAQLQGADLTEAQLQGAILKDTELIGADLNGANTDLALFEYVNLQGVGSKVDSSKYTGFISIRNEEWNADDYEKVKVEIGKISNKDKRASTLDHIEKVYHETQRTQKFKLASEATKGCLVINTDKIMTPTGCNSIDGALPRNYIKEYLAFYNKILCESDLDKAPLQAWVENVPHNIISLKDIISENLDKESTESRENGIFPDLQHFNNIMTQLTLGECPKAAWITEAWDSSVLDKLIKRRQQQ